MELLSSIPWLTLLPLVVAAVALYLLLPKPVRRPVLIASLLGIAAIVLGAVFLTRTGRAPLPEQILFYAFSGLAILGAGIMLTQRNPARAAISFTLVVMSVCGLFLLQGAPFLMAATLIIYAGAIIVTFLFVLMLAQQKGFSDADDRTREPFLATFAGFVLLGTLLLVIEQAHPDLREFDVLIAKAEEGSAKATMAELGTVIGEKGEYIAAMQRQEKRLRANPAAQGLNVAITNLEEALNPPRPDPVMVRDALREVADVGRRIRDEANSKALPAANVAGIGRLLYSVHLLAVELGGTLLLVATIGAIAITQRSPRRAA